MNQPPAEIAAEKVSSFGERLQLLRGLGTLGISTLRLSRGFMPLLKLLGSPDDIVRDQLTDVIDKAFEGLYQHPVLQSTERLTQALRRHRLIPDEQSTEELIRFIVEQLVARSPVPVPEALVTEFWQFFNELFSAPELKGLGELTLDMVRLVLRSYEPLLTEVINLLKAGRRFNQWQLGELLKRAAQIRSDGAIIRRQLRALRYIKPFFQTDPKDFHAQAKLVAAMVNEFGPFFIKLAQVAAANSDFLPEEIARELSVFHEDVAPMSAEEVTAAFMECYGQPPEKLYMGFTADKPLKSGSIGSVYLAKKPFLEGGREVLRPVIIKVGRHNIDREFAIGKLVIGLAIMSTQYWAPHSKLAPFLHAMQEQVDEFVAGFVEELDFEAEARNQIRFYQRSLNSRVWRVPQLYSSTRRILEMEYLGGAVSLSRVLASLPKVQRRRVQFRLAEQLLYSVVYHAFAYREIHGDLHPGNVMMGLDGRLNLIDWGNVIDLQGKWRPMLDYLTGAVLADSDLLTEALIRISTQPAANSARRAEIRAALDETLLKKGVSRLTRSTFVGELRRGGLEGFQKRAQTVLHLMANTQHVGLVLDRDYLHLSRALFAMAGSIGTLYEGETGRRLAIDIARAVLRLPANLTLELFAREMQALRARISGALEQDRVEPVPIHPRPPRKPAALPVSAASAIA